MRSSLVRTTCAACLSAGLSIASIDATGSHFDLPVPRVAHHDVARQHCANLVLQQESFMRQAGVASAEDDVTGEIDANPCFQGLPHIDFSQHPKALGLKSFLGARYSFIKRDRKQAVD